MPFADLIRSDNEADFIERQLAGFERKACFGA
jgi:hypothetical protein